MVNGEIYKREEGIWWTFVLIFLGLNDKMEALYGMLHLSRHEDESLSCPMFQHDKAGKYAFTEKELLEEWHSNKWIKLRGRLTFEEQDECWVDEYLILKESK